LRARFRSIVIAAAVSVTGCGEGEVRGRAGAASAPAEDGEIAITRVGFSTPESVIHDSVADVYLVSNIEGAPAAKDDNGFIARLSPDGYVQQLRWIDGAAQNVTLHAPKGMAISGDTLYVADIDCVRRFVRTTGATAGDICAFEGATFLNDIAVDSLGTLYVTDSGLEPDLTPSGTDAIWRFTPAGLTGKVVEGSLLGAPNGIAFRGQDGFVVTFRSGELYQIGPSNNRDIILSGALDRGLDGIEFTRDGGFLFSSWGDKAVHRVDAQGHTSRLLENVQTPADIGYDARRNRALVPLLEMNEVRITPLDAPASTTGRGLR
jgi:sugar lactone lactonase YvrE